MNNNFIWLPFVQSSWCYVREGIGAWSGGCHCFQEMNKRTRERLRRGFVPSIDFMLGIIVGKGQRQVACCHSVICSGQWRGAVHGRACNVLTDAEEQRNNSTGITFYFNYNVCSLILRIAVQLVVSFHIQVQVLDDGVDVEDTKWLDCGWSRSILSNWGFLGGRHISTEIHRDISWFAKIVVESWLTRPSGAHWSGVPVPGHSRGRKGEFSGRICKLCFFSINSLLWFDLHVPAGTYSTSWSPDGSHCAEY